MNQITYNTPINTVCQDCNTCLCPSCSQKYAVPVCDHCNLLRLKQEKNSIAHEMLFYGAVFCAALLFFTWQHFSLWMQGSSSSLLWIPLAGYGLAGWFAGGKSLCQAGIQQQTGTRIGFLSLLYYVLWFATAAVVGMFTLPVHLWRGFKRLQALRTLVETIHSNIGKTNDAHHHCSLPTGGYGLSSMFYNPSEN